MDFIDWRKTPDKQSVDTEKTPARRYYGRHFYDYVNEQIRDAQEHGVFDNLPGSGKPLNLSDDHYAGDKAQGYHLLKSNGYAPFEIELDKEIRRDVGRMDAKLARVRHQGQSMRARRVPPFASEKRAYNAAVEKAADEYETALRELNSKILTLNLTAPVIMHKPLFEVEPLVQAFRETCPLFEEK
ncbi:MAG: DnaJ family domain-containing protein [Ktedonobacteraceae bacterium]|jgi:DnaJ homolog subfamily C member 28